MTKAEKLWREKHDAALKEAEFQQKLRLKAIDETERQMQEINTLMDAFFTQTAISYGTVTENGYELRLPAPVKELNAKYEVHATLDESTWVITASPRRTEG